MKKPVVFSLKLKEREMRDIVQGVKELLQMAEDAVSTLELECDEMTDEEEALDNLVADIYVFLSVVEPEE